jgi:hypothetical protein
MLSGNALAPGSAIDDGAASAVVTQKTEENTDVASAACVRRAANEGKEFTIEI